MVLNGGDHLIIESDGLLNIGRIFMGTPELQVFGYGLSLCILPAVFPTMVYAKHSVWVVSGNDSERGRVHIVVAGYHRKRPEAATRDQKQHGILCRPGMSLSGRTADILNTE